MAEDQPPPRRDPADDEISLYDLYWALVRRKWIIVGITAACIALGVVYALLREPSYTYTTTLEIGRVAVEDRAQDEVGFEMELIDARSAVEPLLTETIIPMVRGQILAGDDESGGAERPPDMTVSVPDGGSRLLHLRSEGPVARADRIESTHDRVVGELKAGHDRDFERVEARLQRVLADLEGEYQSQVAEIDAEMSTLQREKPNVESALERLDARREALKGYIDNLEARLERAQQREDEAAEGVMGEANAMTLLLLQSNVDEMHTRLERLEEELAAELPRRRSELEVRLAEIESRLENLQAERDRHEARFQRQSAEIESTLDRMHPTRARALALKSISPSGAGSALIVALSAVLGGMLGVFGAFLAEFLAGARRWVEQAEE